MYDYEVILAFSGRPSKRRWIRALSMREAWSRAYQMAETLNASDVALEAI